MCLPPFVGKHFYPFVICVFVYSRLESMLAILLVDFVAFALPLSKLINFTSNLSRVHLGSEIGL